MNSPSSLYSISSPVKQCDYSLTTRIPLTLEVGVAYGGTDGGRTALDTPEKDGLGMAVTAYYAFDVKLNLLF